jgi:hypothetical protein
MTMPPAPGILSVASSVTRPDRCSPDRFNDWYENQHIDEVVALSAVPGAVRYDAVPFSEIAGAEVEEKDLPPWLGKAQWLTLYEMDDVEFRHSAEFKGLDGQTTPKENLLDEIFRNARFETRFGSLVLTDDKAAKGARQSPSTLLISATLTPGSEANARDLEEWYEKEHIPLISKTPNYVRTRLFRHVDTTVLHEFTRQEADPVGPGSYLALHEFLGERLDMAEIAKVDETEWTAKILEGLKEGGMEAMFWRRKRVYGQFLGGSFKL